MPTAMKIARVAAWARSPQTGGRRGAMIAAGSRRQAPLMNTAQTSSHAPRPRKRMGSVKRPFVIAPSQAPDAWPQRSWAYCPAPTPRQETCLRKMHP